MPILTTVRSICVVLCFAGLANAQEPPPLEPPGPGAAQDVGTRPQPPGGSPPRSPRIQACEAETGRRGPARGRHSRPRPAESGPMLAIPGVTAPSPPRPQPAGRTQSASPPASRNIPLLLKARRVAGTGAVDPDAHRINRDTTVEALPGPSGPGSIPMTIEPLLDEPLPDRTPDKPSTARPLPRRTPGTAMPNLPDEDKERSTPAGPPPRARHPGSLLRTAPAAPARRPRATLRGDSKTRTDSETECRPHREAPDRATDPRDARR